jgi:hypothetical protein
VTDPDTFRLTQYARGGGCACKIPPGELEETVSKLMPDGPGTDLMVGVEHGDDGAVVRISPAMAVVVTADFFTPVVDDAYTFGRIAATNALSDIYAMGGEPLVALNLLGWPRDKLPTELAAEVLRGGLDVGRAAHCHVAGGHSIDDPEPKYGMAVTGTADPDALLRIDAGQPGLPLSLTKPIGTGVLNAWHKATGEVSPAAIDVMTTLNAESGQRDVGGGRPRSGAAHRGHAGRGAGRVHAGREPAEPRMGAPAHRHRRGGRGRSASARGRADVRRAARGRGAAGSAGDRGTGPAPRQRAHHPIALAFHPVAQASRPACNRMRLPAHLYKRRRAGRGGAGMLAFSRSAFKERWCGDVRGGVRRVCGDHVAAPAADGVPALR